MAARPYGGTIPEPPAMRRFALFLSVTILCLLAWTLPVLACACCSNEGQRYVKVEKLEAHRLEVFKQLRFAKRARLYLGESDLGDVKGIERPADSYDLSVTFTGNRMQFAFRDDKKNEGTLTVAVPESISIFEVDPREPDGGKDRVGPLLYKEWKLIANFSGTGIFRSGNGGYQKIALIAQGRGNSCTDAESFTPWTLYIYGPAGEYLLFGELVKQ